MVAGEAVDGHAPDLGVAGRELVGPGPGVERTGGIDLGLPRRLGHQVLGQLAGRRLGPSDDLGAIARRDEGDLHARTAVTR